MIAVDTNILVYAHRREMPLHNEALTVLEQLLEKGDLWAIAWPCISEFIAVVTNTRIFKTPTPLALAFDTIQSWHQGNNLRLLSEGPDFLEVLKSISLPTKLSGARIHDARVAALCLHHGIGELWSSDRDFSLFPRIRVRNPLV